jgi:hypothetical protein
MLGSFGTHYCLATLCFLRRDLTASRWLQQSVHVLSWSMRFLLPTHPVLHCIAHGPCCLSGLQRKRLADEKRTAEEAELAARLAYEARAEFEKEEAERKAAKEALKAFLLKCVSGTVWCSSRLLCNVVCWGWWCPVHALPAAGKCK